MLFKKEVKGNSSSPLTFQSVVSVDHVGSVL